MSHGLPDDARPRQFGLPLATAMADRSGHRHARKAGRQFLPARPACFCARHVHVIDMPT